MPSDDPAFNMKIALFHPGVPPFVQQTARAYHEAGLLDRFYTTFAYQPSRFSGRVLRRLCSRFSEKAEKELSRRQLTGLPPETVSTHPAREVMRTLGTKLAGSVVQDYLWEKTEIDFDRHVSRSNWNGAAAVHGYEHAALETFEKARLLGKKLVYEMPAPFHKTTSAILERERARFPALATPQTRSIEKKTAARNRRREREAEMADLVICNSDFTARSLIEHGVPRERILTIPYGMPPPTPSPPSDTPDELVFLYAGTLSARKGVHYLLEAWRRLKPPPDVQLRMFGALDLPTRLVEGLPGNVSIQPSIPRPDLCANYRKASLLLFPTLCDGFGMVLTEALSQGLPVLTTKNAGAGGFIVHGCNGFLVEPADADAIAETLTWCMSNREALNAMRPVCLETAKRWQWSDYRREVAAQVRSWLEGGG